MKMVSKDGQTMVEATRIWVEGDKIVMQCKLMEAYSMPVYLSKQELRGIVSLLSWDLVKAIPDMLFKDTVMTDMYDDLKDKNIVSETNGNGLFGFGMEMLGAMLQDSRKRVE